MIGLFKKNSSNCLKYDMSKNHFISVKSITYSMF